jgi:hypothetical protein
LHARNTVCGQKSRWYVLSFVAELATGVLGHIAQEDHVAKVEVGVLHVLIIGMRNLAPSTHDAPKHHKAPA